MKFDETEMKSKSDHSYNYKFNFFEKVLWSLRKNGFLI